MKKLYLLIGLFCFLITACEKDSDYLPSESNNEDKLIIKPSNQNKDVILSPDGYLIFKDQESFKRNSDLLEKMTDDEFLLWENQMNFQSAQTYISLVSDQIENLKTVEEFELLKQKYSNKIVFEEDGSVRLSFYATAWDRVLTVDGVMKIGDKLFKFEKDRELIINNGEIEDLIDINSLVKDKDRVKEFYPLAEINKSTLKSLQWGTLLASTVYSTDNKSRLKYSLQLISFNYYGPGVTNPPVLYTEAGFELKVRLQQERKGLLGWYKNETMYYLNNGSQYIDYYQPEHWKNVYYNNVLVREKEGGDYVLDNYVFPYEESGETKNGQTMTFHYYYFVDEYDWTFVEPRIHSFNCTFNSRGVDKLTTITYSNI